MTSTETISPRYHGLDSWNDEAILAAFVEGQERAIAAVRKAHEAIAAAARAIVARIGDSGRIIYVGAGSSGLIAALDGMELGGTFGWPDERVAFILASGTILKPGMTGGIEDDGERGGAEMAALAPRPDDAVIAVAASGSTAFTLAATEAARQAGALTIGLANNQDAPLLLQVDRPIFLESGPEIIVGSTRMNAGTAQKAALGLLSSLAMIRLGHVHDGLMVNLRVDNAKLRNRALAMLVHITGCSQGDAAQALDLCGGRVKPAALVARGLAPAEAERALAAAKGNLRTALTRLN
jgi:N-acetylmuramic acid 6-phosphate etherase